MIAENAWNVRAVLAYVHLWLWTCLNWICKSITKNADVAEFVRALARSALFK